MLKNFQIGNKTIGEDSPVFIVAEMSANHLGSFERAVEIIHAAAKAGADAIKLQTYTPDTLTMKSDKPWFTIGGGTIWDGETLYDLYEKAMTPWEWQPRLKEEAEKCGLLCFSSPFDPTAVDFMAQMDMPAYKIASYEITDIPLIENCARRGKPVILATGIATLNDIELALEACRRAGNEQVMLLKCVSAYPTPYEDVNLRMMQDLGERFDCLVGLSDHTMGNAVDTAAAALGARMVEKHLTLKRSDGGPDGAFSMEPEEFERMVREIRIVEKALGRKEYALTPQQAQERSGARSLFITADIAKGEKLTSDNIRSIRPGNGLPPVMLPQILGSVAAHDLHRGDPLKEEDYIPG